MCISLPIDVSKKSWKGGCILSLPIWVCTLCSGWYTNSENKYIVPIFIFSMINWLSTLHVHSYDTESWWHKRKDLGTAMVKQNLSVAIDKLLTIIIGTL